MAIPGYKILRKIGDGGMSSVYLAIQLSVGREVALKVLAPELRTDPEQGKKFFREANTCGTLSHPNIISLYDVGNEGQFYYIAMDYLPGPSCADKIRQKKLPADDALRIMSDIARALDYIHQNKVVHCDIKPDNILFRHDGSAVLTDFGIAKKLENKTTAVSKIISGTPYYMSPEQFQAKPLDGRSDIYSLGIVFYEMLTGTVPFKGKEAVHVALKHISGEVPELPNELSQFRTFLLKMLAKKPQVRFQSASELANAIDRIRLSNDQEKSGWLPSESSRLPKLSINETFLAVLAVYQRNLRIRVKEFSKSFKYLRFSLRHGIVFIKRIPLLKPDLSQLTEEQTQEHLATVSKTTQLQVDIKDALEQKRAYTIVHASILWLALLVLPFALPLALFPESQYARFTQGKFNQLLSFNNSSNTAYDMPYSQSTRYDDKHLVEGYDIDINPLKQGKHKKSHSLTINTIPVDARISIINIAPRYRHGIKLPPGRYKLRLYRSGYIPITTWFEMTSEDTVINFTLDKIKPVFQRGDIFSDPLKILGTGPKVVVLPIKTARLGDIQNDNIPGAKPAYAYRPGYAFAMSIYEVTLAEFDRFTQDVHAPTINPQVIDRHDTPVTNISWDQATSYTRWLSNQTHEVYRLPTSTEWEYAARAGTSSLYSWQGKQARDKANCDSGCNSEWAGFFGGKIAPIGYYQANAWGLYDTSGNAAEWVSDCAQFNDNNTCVARIIKGGSFNSEEKTISPAAIEHRASHTSAKDIGFRVLREF